MKNIVLIGSAIGLWYYFRKKDVNVIPQYYYTPADYYYFLPVVGVFTFENDIMRYKARIMKEGENNKIEAGIIAGIIANESLGNPNVVNDRFMGLMQIGLSEARAMGYTGNAVGLLNPDTNIYWGTKYLKYCIIKKGGNLLLGISGYNTGQVERSDTPYNEGYVQQVSIYVARFRYLLAQSFPGYANVFPPSIWLKLDEYA